MATSKQTKAAALPSIVEIAKQTGRLDNCITTRNLYDNVENLKEHIFMAAERQLASYSDAERDLVRKFIADGVLFAEVNEWVATGRREFENGQVSIQK